MLEGRSLDKIYIHMGMPLGGQITTPYLTQVDIVLSLIIGSSVN